MRGISPRPGARVAKIGSRRLHRGRLAADHHAIAALQPPDAAAGADVDVVDAVARQLLGSADVVDVVGIAAVDDDVAAFEMRREIGDRLVDHGGRHHQPDRARRRQTLGPNRPARRRRSPSPSPAPRPPWRTCRTPTQRWPPLNRRRAMLAPMRPRPIIPSSMRQFSFDERCSTRSNQRADVSSGPRRGPVPSARASGAFAFCLR